LGILDSFLPKNEVSAEAGQLQNDQEWRDAEGLAEDLGRHPLALDVAGHFLLKTKGFGALRDEIIRGESDPLGDLVAGLIGQLPGGHEKVS